MNVSKAQMLECPPLMGFPRNQWYVAAFSSEVNRSVLKRQLLGDHVVMYRTEDGTAVALQDRCPHRGLPLSQGKLEGDSLRCGYHGMLFGKTGACTHIPSQATIPDRMAVHSYPLVEKSLWIWIWMGDPALADLGMIPDHKDFGLDNPGYTVTEMFRMDIPGNYQLLHENLLDVSHISFLHEGLLDAGGTAITKTDIKYLPDRILISREVEETANEAMAFGFSLELGHRYHRTLSTAMYPPGLNVNINIFRDLDEPERPVQILYGPFAITPANPRETHQFTVSSSSYPVIQSKEAIQFLWNVFEQDNVAIRAIQSLYDDTGRYGPEYSVKVDAAALRCRLRNAELIEKERMSIA